MSTKKRAKPYTEMTTSELAEATAKFDEEFAIDSSREATAEEKEQWRPAKRKRRRPG